MPTTAFLNTRKTNQTLSGSNLVATSSGAGGVHADRPITGLSYFSAVITTLTGAPQIGICAIDSSVASALGSTTSSIGYVLTTGAVQLNGATLATIQTTVAGQRVDVAVHFGYRLIWFRTNAGNWNNSPTADPATLAEGIDFSAMTAPNTMTAAVYASLTGTVWTAQFSTPFTNAAPSGYSSLDVVAYTRAQWSSDPRDTAIPTGQPGPFGFRASSMPRDLFGFKPYNGRTITVVSGTVMELGITVPNKRVDVYDRNTGELLGTAFSASDGTWSIRCLGRPSVRVVADDPTTYNSLVYDNVIPT